MSKMSMATSRSNLVTFAANSDRQLHRAWNVLTGWGLDTAKNSGLVLTLLASPVDEGLYKFDPRLGSRNLGLRKVQINEEKKRI